MPDALPWFGLVQSLVVLSVFVAAALNLGLALSAPLSRTPHPAVNLSVAVAFGFLALGLIGLLVWVAPTAKRTVCMTLLVTANAAAAYVNWQDRATVAPLLRANRFILGAWFGVSLVLLMLAQAPLAPRQNLPDGLYPFKRWTLPVRIQFITLLAPDNAVPAFAAEYMARGTSFSDVRPLMPGQEVSNRPLYEAVVYLPFRVAFGTTRPAPSPYPTYDYVGSRWPDTSQLISDNSFAKFLAVAIPLNASLLLAFGALLELFSIPHARLCLTAFGALSPYLWHHSIFTWPKNMAAFYLVLAVVFLLARGPPAIAGLFIGLAYLSHPYVIAFMIALAGATVIEIVRQHLYPKRGSVIGIELSKGQLLAMWITTIAVIAPWHVWTMLVLQIPSDLVSQNIGLTGSVWGFVSMRIGKLVSTLLPTFLLPPTWADGELRGVMLTSLVSAVGVVPLIFLPWALVRTTRELPLPALWLGLVTGLLLISVSGVLGSRPLLNGWQAIWPGLVVVTLLAMSRRFGPKAVLAASCVQLPVNICYLVLHATSLYKGA